jgi:prepilin-type N-terminal cleavage/methylation domain-containing protein
MNLSCRRRARGFTVIELLLVIAIIGLIAVVAVYGIDQARKRSRDTFRLADMRQLGQALQLYLDDRRAYPPPSNDGEACDGWDTSADGVFLQALVDGGYVNNPVTDPNRNAECGNYRYFVYPSGFGGCDPTQGRFYVLEVDGFEATSGRHPDSPGFACADRDWTGDAAWVTGAFE